MSRAMRALERWLSRFSDLQRLAMVMAVATALPVINRVLSCKPESSALRAPGVPSMQPSRSLLLRFLFPVGLPKAPHGDMFLQRSMLLANLESLRRWMPHYVRVHAALAAGLALMLCGVCSCEGPGGWRLAAPWPVASKCCWWWSSAAWRWPPACLRLTATEPRRMGHHCPHGRQDPLARRTAGEGLAA